MEPITTTLVGAIFSQFQASTLLGTIVGGIVGNRADALLCNSTNHIYQRLRNTLGEPENHDIQKAVRRSILKATLIAVDHTQKNYKVLDRVSSNNPWDLGEIKKYLKKELRALDKGKVKFPDQEAYPGFQEMLSTKKMSSQARIPEYISNLKQSIISELERRRLRVELALKDHFENGWTEGNKKVDWYELATAFFAEELKTNPRLSTIIEASYLEDISRTSQDIQLSVGDLQDSIEVFYELHKDLLSRIDNILESLERIEERLEELPGEVQKMVAQAFKESGFSGQVPKFTVNSRYQHLLEELDKLEKEEKEIKRDIADFQQELEEAEENKKSRKKRLLERAETEFLEISEKRAGAQQELQAFITNVLKLAEQLSQEQEMTTPRLEKARELFAAGKFEDVDQILNEKEIYADIDKHEERGKELANELLVKAKAVLANKQEDWFSRARKYFADAARIWTSFDTFFEFAKFLDDHRQIRQAVEWYEKAVPLATGDDQRAPLLNNLGLLQRAQNEYEKAAASFEEALSIRRKLAEVNP